MDGQRVDGQRVDGQRVVGDGQRVVGDGWPFLHWPVSLLLPLLVSPGSGRPLAFIRSYNPFLL